MRKKILWLAVAIVIIVLVVVLFDSIPKRPYINLDNNSVVSIEVYAMNPVPPAIKAVEDRAAINEIVDLIKAVETSHIVYTGHTGGQLVRFTFYGICNILNCIGNTILETGFGVDGGENAEVAP